MSREEGQVFIDSMRDIQALHNKFSNVLDEIKDINSKVNFFFEDGEEEEEEADPLFQSQITREQEIRLLYREIQQIQHDVKSLIDLMDSGRSSDRAQAAKVRRQLDDLMQILDGQLFRAERLMK
ncbi:hypothetical protein TVAG_315950 [Trichomonas vaginalis G3]|uniref:Uncharacterized protein n=1 Tax=Trichomonas vaginalis (strain ATCC PRA-98 / G3) TaxID=412133 RepID=A2G8I8_TRIV3|nr:hypothetical protein TVAGG3_0922030 [Trichomonas vaginalis G3]EAX86528.1 hypothetical protein TVAG_315950 [Trichomonas vaginalis G3]KAI5485189.1 hypothetical protein TVAGG3_0922030 [Trichomonas vaginalis G3]|eukprot:XP_001299458.1 hypothetical protein [Trichomonas vaginalis G3]